MATGFPVKANYATGDVLTAANMNDLSGTVNYLQYMPPRNAILNSNFSVWQRGTSFAGSVAASNIYAADRWNIYRDGFTFSRQVTGDTTNLPNIQYCMRVQRNNGSTQTSAGWLDQPFETVNSIPFAGKTVTLSFYARAGANYSPTSSLLNVYLKTGTGTDQRPLDGYTGELNQINSTATLTTTWQRFSFTATLSSNITELAPVFLMNPTGTAGTNDYYEITGIQLELGSSANSYMPNQPTYQGELAACQRYYYRFIADNLYTNFGLGFANSTTNATMSITAPVQMRTLPTSVDYSTLRFTDYGSTYSISSVVIDNSGNGRNTQVISGTSTSLTTNRGYAITANNSTSAYLGFSAEL